MQIEELHLYLKSQLETINQIRNDINITQSRREELLKLAYQYYADTFQGLFKLSHIESYDWEYCSFKVYKDCIDKKFNDFEKQNIDKDIKDFYNSEIKKLENQENYFELSIIDKVTLKIVVEARYKKIEFLKSNLSELESSVFENLIDDFIDLGKISAKEKMVYLYKLGVLDFLLNEQPFISTGNGLASILCSILGEKKTTIQPIISAIVSDNITNKNHPFYTKSTEKKVNQHLIGIGFNPKKTI